MSKFECAVDGVQVTCEASEIASGGFWVTASIEGGLTYGFVIVPYGNKAKNQKYQCTRALRLTPITKQIVKDETPVLIVGFVSTAEKVFEHVIESLVDYSDDSRTN